MRPWRAVYPTPTVDEPDLGPQADTVKALLSALPQLAGRCHDVTGQALFEALVDRSFVGEADRAEAAASAFQAAVLTRRRRVWALVRRTGAEGMARACSNCRSTGRHGPREARVLALCLDAACALLVADALPDDLDRAAHRPGAARSSRCSGDPAGPAEQLVDAQALTTRSGVHAGQVRALAAEVLPVAAARGRARRCRSRPCSRPPGPAAAAASAGRGAPGGCSPRRPRRTARTPRRPARPRTALSGRPLPPRP